MSTTEVRTSVAKKLQLKNAERILMTTEQAIKKTVALGGGDWALLVATTVMWGLTFRFDY